MIDTRESSGGVGFAILLLERQKQTEVGPAPGGSLVPVLAGL